jgi:hypothetical protein
MILVPHATSYGKRNNRRSATLLAASSKLGMTNSALSCGIRKQRAWPWQSQVGLKSGSGTALLDPVRRLQLARVRENLGIEAVL